MHAQIKVDMVAKTEYITRCRLRARKLQGDMQRSP